MKLEHFASRFEKLSKLHNLKFSLGKSADETQILLAEENLCVSFPPQIVLFYRHFNGLWVETPMLEILSLEQISFVSPNHLHFATFGGNHRVFFDTSQINNANQWNIIGEDNYVITLTMASFWSNKIFA